MISDSNIWRAELFRDVNQLRRRLRRAATPQSRGITEGVAAQIEKFSFTSAFIVRKLLDAWKLSDELEFTPLRVQKFPVIDEDTLIDYMNCHRGPEFYDFGKGRDAHILPRDLCNLLIHSMVFCPLLEEDEREVSALLFNSDRTKYKALFQIDLDVYLTFIDDVIADEIVSAAYYRWNGRVFKSRELTEASIERQLKSAMENMPAKFPPGGALTRSYVEEMMRQRGARTR